jgi:hypothetical protein
MFSALRGGACGIGHIKIGCVTFNRLAMEKFVGRRKGQAEERKMLHKSMNAGCSVPKCLE